MAATQSQHPVRATIRTVFAFLASFALIVPLVVEATGVDAGTYPWIAAVVAGAAAVTRILAIPQVNEFLQRWVFTSWLAAAPEGEFVVNESTFDAEEFDGFWDDEDHPQY